MLVRVLQHQHVRAQRDLTAVGGQATAHADGGGSGAPRAEASGGGAAFVGAALGFGRASCDFCAAVLWDV